jgi:NAD+ kinase
MPDVLFVLHSRVSAGDPAVVRASSALTAHGHEVELFQRTTLSDKPGRVEDDRSLEPARVDGKKLVVTFGGDGTFIHAARTALVHDVPVMGVNLGRLGFLAWVTLETAEAACAAWAEGRFELEQRATMVVHYGDGSYLAINEAALLKDPAANVIQLEVSVDGVEAGMFHADGCVVATPTGSTAYAASAGGPILDPRAEAMVLVPLNPHTLATRALVVSPGQKIELRVDEETRLLLDGAVIIAVSTNADLTCALDGPLLKVVRTPGTEDFYSQLREKMGWGEPLVREGRR